MERDGLAWIAGWSVHGRALDVRDVPEFEARVLPNYFQIKKYTSFQRQLNLYGFKRITSGRDAGAYYHQAFLRSKPFLCNRIQRVKIKGAGPRKPSNPAAEPDLYSFPALPMLKTQARDATNKKLPAVKTEPESPGRPKSGFQLASAGLTGDHATTVASAPIVFPLDATQLPASLLAQPPDAQGQQQGLDQPFNPLLAQGAFPFALSAQQALQADTFPQPSSPSRSSQIDSALTSPGRQQASQEALAASLLLHLAPASPSPAPAPQAPNPEQVYAIVRQYQRQQGLASSESSSPPSDEPSSPPA